MTEWQELPLERCLSALIDYRGKSPRKSTTGIPVISAKVVKEGRILHPIEQTIDPEYYSEWMRRGLPNSGDVVLTTEGPLGEVAQLDDETARYALGQRIVVLRGRDGLLDNTFLKFLLQSDIAQRRLLAFATGTTVSGVSQKSLRQLPLPLPPIQEQQRIAGLLGSLDDKIELNRRMNDTLEAMAQAIFRDWFVDFGPTRRKLEGATDPVTIMGGLVTDPTRAQELANLFPATLGDDGLPKGWEASTLAASSILIKRGLTPKYTDDGIVVINQKCIRNGNVSLGPARLHDASKRSPGERLLEHGDVLVNSTGVGTLGRVATYRKHGVTATADSHVTICRADTAKISKLIFALTLEQYQPDIEAMGQGSTGQTELSPHSLGALPLVVPGRTIQKAFDTLVSPLREMVELNIDQSVSLASTRDLLLPKLMSGEVQLHETAQVEP